MSRHSTTDGDGTFCPNENDRAALTVQDLIELLEQLPVKTRQSSPVTAAGTSVVGTDVQKVKSKTVVKLILLEEIEEE